MSTSHLSTLCHINKWTRAQKGDSEQILLPSLSPIIIMPRIPKSSPPYSRPLELIVEGGEIPEEGQVASRAPAAKRCSLR